ncbi:MAG: hypothetical protein ABIE03_06210 [Patescibacteria group bacterium]
MATSTVFVKYRPIKVAFLVEKGDIDGLVKVAGINTLLWGGIYNPIIPVSPSNRDHVNQLLKLFNADVLYKVSETSEIQTIYDELPYLRDPSHIGERIFYEDWHTKKNLLAYLDSLSIVNFYWEKEFRHTGKKFKSNCLLLDWDSADKYSSLFSLMFGYFPDAYNLRDNYKEAFEKGLKSKIDKLDVSTGLPKDLSKKITPIIATGLELNGYGGGFREDGIYIGEEQKFIDLVNFWNLRASGLSIKFLPKNDISRFKDYIQSYLSKLDKRPNRNPNITESIAVYHQDRHEDISAILKNFTISNKHFSLSHCDEHSWNGLNIKPKDFYFKSERTLAHIEKSYDSYSVSFALPEKKFLVEGFDSQQSLVAEINPITETFHPRRTFKLPFLRELNEFYSREMCFDPWTVRVGDGGIGLIIKTDDNNLEVRPIKHEKIIKEIFRLAGYKAQVNQSGLLTDQIITSMREQHPLEACRVFKIRGVRELLKQLTPNMKIKWSDATRTIWNKGQFKNYEGLYIEARDKKTLDTQSTLNFLIKKNILRPHLKFYHRFFARKNFKCRNCGLNENIKLSNYEGTYTCQYCKYEHSMSQYIVDDIQGVVNKYFTFTKSGLFSKSNNQEGAIPVVLTLLTLQRIIHDGEIIYSTAMNLEGDIKCEVDFAVLSIKHGKIEFGIAECKSEGKKKKNQEDIDTKDVNNLKHLQDKLNDLGIDCYIILSKTNDSFKDSELSLFKKLNEEDRHFVLLTNKELEPYEPYWDLEETERLPKKYALSLEDMCYNSQYIYLREESTTQ